MHIKYKKIKEPRPTPEQSRTFLKLAQEMHELNPQVPLRDCLCRIIERHKKNAGKPGFRL